jgi:hypothetical protein
MGGAIQIGSKRMSKFDTHELAWAAGFFDGEGCTNTAVRKDGSSSIRLVVDQSDDNGVPETLIRFQKAIGGLGSINGPQIRPNRKPKYVFVVAKYIEVQLVLSLLWPYLSTPKRKQATRSIIKLELDGFWRLARMTDESSVNSTVRLSSTTGSSVP